MESAKEGKTFLLVGRTKEAGWASVLQEAISPLGILSVVSECEVEAPTFQLCHFDVIILDAGVVPEVASLVSRLHEQKPEVRIVIATASPTWRRAREVLQAGAADYIRKSLEARKIRAEIKTVLESPSAFRRY